MKRGRKPQPYGENKPCPTCMETKPRYRNGALIGCSRCGGPGNSRWPKTI